MWGYFFPFLFYFIPYFSAPHLVLIDAPSTCQGHPMHESSDSPRWMDASPYEIRLQGLQILTGLHAYLSTERIRASSSSVISARVCGDRWMSRCEGIEKRKLTWMWPVWCGRLNVNHKDFTSQASRGVNIFCLSYIKQVKIANQVKALPEACFSSFNHLFLLNKVNVSGFAHNPQRDLNLAVTSFLHWRRGLDCHLK